MSSPPWQRCLVGLLAVAGLQPSRYISRQTRLAATRSDSSLILERCLDTLEDAALHFKRKIIKTTYTDDDKRDALGEWRREDDPRPRLLVLGSGWAAHALVKIIDTNIYRVLVVSPRPFFVFTPMLASTAVGTVEYRSICEPIRASNPLVSYLEGTCTSVDPSHGRVEVDAMKIDYDTLVYAVGVGVGDFGVPGVKEHSLCMKEIHDAVAVRLAIAKQLERSLRPGLSEQERSRCLSMIVVGGGATGVEFAAELCDFVEEAVARFYPQLRSLVKITLVHAGDELLQQFDQPELKRTALESLRGRGVDVRLKTRCVEIQADAVIVNHASLNETIGSGLCVWSAGTAARPLTMQLIEACGQTPSRYGKILVDGHLRVLGSQTSVLALGDAASSSDDSPQTAQVAAQQGAYAARLLNRGYDLEKGRPPTLTNPTAVDKALLPLVKPDDPYEAKPFAFLNLGQLAFLGGGEAISQVQFGEKVLFAEAGSVGFLLWRSVYLAKQVAFRNRVLVVFDWLKSIAFGRDITQV